jgi:hypothetical protein
MLGPLPCTFVDATLEIPSELFRIVWGGLPRSHGPFAFKRLPP